MNLLTSFGGSDGDSVTSMAVGQAGDIYIAGWTYSRDLKAHNQPFSSNLYRLEGGGTRPVYTLPGDVYHISGNPEAVFAGTSRGAFRSDDGGVTWSRVNGLPDGCVEIAVAPVDVNTLYAVPCAGLTYDFFRSMDGGDSWTMSRLPFPEYCSVWNCEIVVDPRQSKIVYLDRWRSPDGGVTWARSATPFGFHPKRSGVVFGKDQFSNIARSTDHGATWETLSPKRQIGVAILTPSGVLFASMLGGLMRSDDDAATWITTRLSGGVRALGMDPFDATLYAIVGENDGPRHLLRSPDGFATWTTQPVTDNLRQIWTANSGGTTSTYLSGDHTRDAFVARLAPDGELAGALYLGGSGDDDAVALALGPAGEVYVAGTTLSHDFPGLPGRTSGYTFLVKIAPDVDHVEETAVLGYYHGQGDWRGPSALAVDSRGRILMGVYQSEEHCSAEAGSHTPTCRTETVSWIDTFDSVSTEPIRSASQPSAGIDALLLHPDGSLYTAGGNWVRRMNAAGNVDRANQLPMSWVSQGVLDGNGNLVIAGKTFHTSGQDSFVAVLRAEDLQVVHWEHVGDQRTSVAAVNVDGRGRPVIAGGTSSHRYPTRAPIEGAFENSAGFLSILEADVSNACFSSFLNGPGKFESRAVARTADGGLLVAGSGTAEEATSDVFLHLLPPFEPRVERLDSVMNAASRDARPLAPGERLMLKTSGFPADARVLVDGVPLARTFDGTIVLPDDIDSRPVAEVAVDSDGVSSNAVRMPTAAHAPAVYTADGSGSGQAVAFNEDGTANSRDTPARYGSIVSVPLNGAGLHLDRVSILVQLGDGYSIVWSVAGETTTRHGGAAIQFRIPDLRRGYHPDGLKLWNATLTVSIAGAMSQPDVTLAIAP